MSGIVQINMLNMFNYTVKQILVNLHENKIDEAMDKCTAALHCIEKLEKSERIKLVCKNDPHP